ncbi:hypothetical protein FA15DRAFT_605988, partial [Coprinopsis marcescibilis]
MVQTPRPDLRIGDHVIKSQPTALFLGVTIDNTLRWKEQAIAAAVKGLKWLQQFSQLSRPSRGVSFSHMRHLYLAIAVPRMLYAADVFLTP